MSKVKTKGRKRTTSGTSKRRKRGGVASGRSNGRLSKSGTEFSERLLGSDIEMLVGGTLVEAKSLNLPIEETSRRVLSNIMLCIREALLNGKSVTLARITTLTPYTKRKSKYRHPVTGALRTAKPRRHIRMALAHGMKKALAKIEV